MKVIFIEDVPNVAQAGEVRVVANGYARNFLIPRKLAVRENSLAASVLEAHLKKVAKRRAIEEAAMAELAKSITGTEITIKAKVGEKERLYGSVTSADIVEELAKVIDREVDKRKVELAEPIRQVGVYDVTIRFAREITAAIKVTVMSDEEGAAKPSEASEEPVATAEAAAPEASAEAPVEETAVEEAAPKATAEATAEEEAKPEKKAKPRAARKPKAKKEGPAVEEAEEPAKSEIEEIAEEIEAAEDKE